MSDTISLAGAGARVRGRFPAPLDHEVHAAVADALAEAGVALQQVDAVVTVGSDVVDAILLPMRTELYSAAGRACLNVSSGAGDGFGAAMATLEAGQAGTVLLVGWGEGSKGAVEDALPLQAEPFHARRVGAQALALSRMQAQWLAGEHSSTASWEPPVWSDGAAAVVLRRGAHDGASQVVDFASSWLPYTPESAEDLDPARWVETAWARLSSAADWERQAPQHLACIEASAASSICERRALAPLLRRARWQADDARINRGGGGAAAWFGTATGLHALVQAHRALRQEARNGRCALAAVLDLAGPIGQATTAILLRQGEAA